MDAQQQAPNIKGARTVSPPMNGIKRERSDDEEETRRVSQRTDDTEAQPDEKSLIAAIDKLFEQVDVKTTTVRKCFEVLEAEFKVKFNKTTKRFVKDRLVHLTLNDKATDNNASATWTASNEITEYVKGIACSTEEEEVIELMKKLRASLRGANQLRQRQLLFLGVGGPVSIVAAMEKYPGCRLLQQEGTAVLINAARVNKEVHSILAEVGGLHAIVVAMKRFPTSEETQRLSLMALHNASLHIQDKLIPVLESYGFDGATGAMNSFPASMDILSFGCKLLLNLSASETLKKRMRDAKVATTLSSVIDSDQVGESIQKEAIAAMKALL